LSLSQAPAHLRPLPPFPTRRSSDLFNPARWAEASAQSPRVYCLGECFAAPAKGQTHPRPPVKVFSRHGIVLGRIAAGGARSIARSEEHTSELQSRSDLVCRLLLEKK